MKDACPFDQASVGRRIMDCPPFPARPHLPHSPLQHPPSPLLRQPHNTPRHHTPPTPCIHHTSVSIWFVIKICIVELIFMAFYTNVPHRSPPPKIAITCPFQDMLQNSKLAEGVDIARRAVFRCSSTVDAARHCGRREPPVELMSVQSLRIPPPVADHLRLHILHPPNPPHIRSSP